MAKAEIETRKRNSESAYRKEHEKQKAIAKEQNRPFWRDLFAKQKAQADQSRHQIEAALKAERSARSFLGRAAAFIGLGESVDKVQARVITAKMDHEGLLARQESQRAAAYTAQRQDIAERTQAALPPAPRLDLSAMKEQHRREWEKTRERQNAEREAAGLRPIVRERDTGRDPDRKAEVPSPAPSSEHRSTEADRQARLREQAQEEVRKAHERDRQGRGRGDHYDRDR